MGGGTAMSVERTLIEVLGVGVEDGRNGWLLHRVCTRLAASQITAVVSSRREERETLLDILGGRRVPGEGRVWIDRAPLTSDTVSRLRGRMAEVDLAGLAEQRSVMWNVLAGSSGGRRLRTFLRLPRPGDWRAAQRALAAVGQTREGAAARVASLDRDARMQVMVARALVSAPSVLVVRDPDVALGAADAMRLMTTLRALTRAERIAVVAGLGGPALAHAFADRLLAIAEGALVFDGAPAEPEASGRAFRLGPIAVGE